MPTNSFDTQVLFTSSKWDNAQAICIGGNSGQYGPHVYAWYDDSMPYLFVSFDGGSSKAFLQCNSLLGAAADTNDQARLEIEETSTSNNPVVAFQHDSNAFWSIGAEGSMQTSLECEWYTDAVGFTAELAVGEDFGQTSNMLRGDAADLPLPCNGSPALCDLPVSSVVFPGVHNAMSSQADGFQAPNNLLGMEDALDAGIRALHLDSCDCGSTGLQMCHGECYYFGFIKLGHRDPLALFSNIKAFLDDNPREVIVIDLQVNHGTLDALYYNILDTIPGFTEMLYFHPRPQDPWPTLGTLIGANQRILFFQHNGNNCDIEGACPPGIMGTFQHMFDTPWDLDEDGLLDFDRSCTTNRGMADAQLMLSNHFADEGLFPSPEISRNVNQLAVLRNRHEFCREKLEKEANVILVDFWSLGGVIEYAKEENEKRAKVVTLGNKAVTKWGAGVLKPRGLSGKVRSVFAHGSSYVGDNFFRITFVLNSHIFCTFCEKNLTDPQAPKASKASKASKAPKASKGTTQAPTQAPIVSSAATALNFPSFEKVFYSCVVLFLVML